MIGVIMDVILCKCGDELHLVNLGGSSEDDDNKYYTYLLRCFLCGREYYIVDNEDI